MKLQSPHKYPIYDQHVHRAMSWIDSGRPQEIPARDPDRIESYLTRFLRFYDLFAGLDARRVDKALWACGRSMKPLSSITVE